MRSRKAQAEDHANPEAWVIPYADLLTLLLAMFLALWATGRVDADKFRQLANAFHSQIGTEKVKVVDPAINQGSDAQNLLSFGGLGVLDGGWTSSLTKMMAQVQLDRAKEIVDAKDAEAAAHQHEQQILQGIQKDVGPDSVISARLEPVVVEAAENGNGTGKASKAAAAAAVVAAVGAGAENDAGADAVLAASVFHYGELTIGQVKAALRSHGLPVR